MIRLRLPPAHVPAPAPLPPELRWDAPRATVALLLSRRQFLRAAVVATAGLALPWTRTQQAWARARGSYFTRNERATLAALCDRIIPPDGDPGGAALGAARYIEGLLGALEPRRPLVFAGGPFSGRTPFADAKKGTPSRRRPRNAFKRFTELTRLQELFWRGELYGTATVPELAAMDAQQGGPKVGLRDVYRAGLQKVDEVAQATHGAPFARLDAATQDAVFAMLDAGAFMPDPRRGGATFPTLLIHHVLEGCFAVPEYGGNRRRRGWAMLGLEGDSQPLGYSLFSTTLGDYRERADHPMSTPNPDEVAADGSVAPRPLSADGAAIQLSISTLSDSLANLC